MKEPQISNRFADRVAIVTGAGSGIGRTAALRLAAEGAIVICTDAVESAAIQTSTASGANAVGKRLDVTDEIAWQMVVDRVLSEHGRLDTLIHCAGISAGAPLAEMTFDDWRRTISVNLDGSFLAVRQGLRAMASRGGSIVLVSSASGVKAAAGAAAYSSSKAGVCMLAKSAAKECRDKNVPVRVNTVCPAGVKTPMWSTMPFFREMVQSQGSEEAAYASLAAAQGGSFAETADVVAAILFLASDESRFINGIDLLVDAGYVL